MIPKPKAVVIISGPATKPVAVTLAGVPLELARKYASSKPLRRPPLPKQS